MPGHVGLPENERADAVATAVVGNMITINGEVPRGVFKMIVKQVSAERRSAAWHGISENKVRERMQKHCSILTDSSSRH